VNIRHSALGLAVAATAVAAFSLAGAPAASAAPNICPIRGCTEILVTGYGATQSLAVADALTLVRDEGCGTAGSGGTGQLADGTWWAKEYGFCP
jgi:hypothetical protein